MDGFEILDWLREWSGVPIIILSARGQEKDKVTALDRGADDYLTKPFGVGELLARVRVAFRNRARRAAPCEEPVFQVGDLRVDLATRRVFAVEMPVRLTPIEYRLLATLVRHAGRVLTHGFLLREVWGPNHSDDPRYIRVFVANLRRKIEFDPSRPQYILTEQGVGYRLVDE
jgi:two-component system KDP operon response regulator KdpE